MQSLKFDTRTIPDVEIIERRLYDVLADSKGAVRKMCSHILSAGGKRIRPLLTLYSGLVFSELTEELINAAVAAELIHMASLVHDDIIDDSSLRRGKPSVNELWGNHFAVLCGDYLFAKAFGILSGNRLIGSMDLMVDAIQNMCQGEILQAGDRFSNEISMEAYYERISKKTAIFLQCCCKSGAAVAGACEVHTEIIGEYGLNIGIAFQVIDDILDFCGDADTMGKPKNGDLCQGNITLPIILLMEDEKQGEWIREAICKKEFTVSDIDSIVAMLKESSAISRAFCIAKSHIDKAVQCLDMLPQTPYTALLYDIAFMLQARTN